MPAHTRLHTDAQTPSGAVTSLHWLKLMTVQLRRTCSHLWCTCVLPASVKGLSETSDLDCEAGRRAYAHLRLLRELCVDVLHSLYWLTWRKATKHKCGPKQKQMSKTGIFFICTIQFFFFSQSVQHKTRIRSARIDETGGWRSKTGTDICFTVHLLSHLFLWCILSEISKYDNT